METKEIRILLEKGEIIGDLTLPEKVLGIVIFAHGSGSSRKSTRNRFVASFLENSGFATLLFDLLSKEEEKKDLVTAKYRFDIPLLASRLETVIRSIRKDPDLKQIPIALFGSSTGAAAALIVAAKENVFAVVSRGGRVDLAGGVLNKVHAPTLFLVGSQDPVVLDLNSAAYNLLECEKKLIIIEGATHLFEEEGKLEEVALRATEWFLSTIGNR